MNIHSFCLILFCIVASNCSGNKSEDVDSSGFKINRFDNDLYQYLTQNPDSNLLLVHDLFLDEYGEKIIRIGTSDSVGFFDRLNAFFSEPTLMRLYRNEQEKFADIQDIEKELFAGLKLFSENFPEIKEPQIYMHVSGLSQNVIVTDDILSLSVDKYLGADYPLYQEFFYDYQRQLMSPDRIVPDYLLGFMMANFLFQGNESVLLDQIIYEGKLRYILSRLLPERKTWEFIGYTQEQHEWCVENESQIWKSILENKHLFNSDYKTTIQYLRSAPYTAILSSESPGRVGIWLGYQIVSSYMKHSPKTSFQELINMTDYQQFLKQARYKP